MAWSVLNLNSLLRLGESWIRMYTQLLLDIFADVFVAAKHCWWAGGMHFSVHILDDGLVGFLDMGLCLLVGPHRFIFNFKDMSAWGLIEQMMAGGWWRGGLRTMIVNE